MQEQLACRLFHTATEVHPASRASQQIALSTERSRTYLSQQSQAVCMRPDYIEHPDVLHECSAHSAALELCTYAVVSLHLSHTVYLYHQMKQ